MNERRKEKGIEKHPENQIMYKMNSGKPILPTYASKFLYFEVYFFPPFHFVLIIISYLLVLFSLSFSLSISSFISMASLPISTLGN